MKIFTLLLLLYIGKTHTSLFTNLKGRIQNLLESNKEGSTEISNGFYRFRTGDDAIDAEMKAKIIQKARADEAHLKRGRDIPPYTPNPNAKQRYHIDPVLNHIKRRSKIFNPYKQGADGSNDSPSSSSSSLEQREWKEEFNDNWLMKKVEAVKNYSKAVRGDIVNMVAARPWGVPCGDPIQHDMPWGSCMMPSECDSEYRIYRGDAFCGQTSFVCCALQLVNYDLYQGFDVSFEDSSDTTDSEERRLKQKGSAEAKKRYEHREKKKHAVARKRRKRQIKKRIRKIVRELRKILNRAYRNSSHHRTLKTRQVQKYIRGLKTQFKKERKAVKDIHVQDMIEVDDRLERHLSQIRQLNQEFLTNSTFRNILFNRTITKTGARMLVQAYPELLEDMPKNILRRTGGGDVEDKSYEGEGYDYIEYGVLYY